MYFGYLFDSPSIDRGLEELRSIENAVLLDLRPSKHYQEGHVPGSQNVPFPSEADLSVLISDIVAEKDAPIFLYCGDGSRSMLASSVLARMGYTDVRYLGGLKTYTGPLVR